MHLGGPSHAKKALCKLKRGTLHAKFAKSEGHVLPVLPGSCVHGYTSKRNHGNIFWGQKGCDMGEGGQKDVVKWGKGCEEVGGAKKSVNLGG